MDTVAMNCARITSDCCSSATCRIAWDGSPEVWDWVKDNLRATEFCALGTMCVLMKCQVRNSIEFLYVSLEILYHNIWWTVVLLVINSVLFVCTPGPAVSTFNS
jgi:hypothetical protein